MPVTSVLGIMDGRKFVANVEKKSGNESMQKPPDDFQRGLEPAIFSFLVLK